MTGHSHSIEDRLSDLLVRWEELHQQGQSVTPEQLCQDSPELLPELKRRIQQLGLINAALKTTTVGECRTPTPFPPVGSDPGTGIESITITSRYLQARLVDRGGMGELLIAEDVSLHREVAVKLIQHRHAGREANISRFLQEAEITSRLDHPGIAPVHTLGQSSDGRPCYTMRFIHGETMAQAIRRFHQAEANPRREPSERSLALRQLLSQSSGYK